MTIRGARDPEQIIAGIQSGMQTRPASALVERQRGLAIAAALQLAGPADAVLIAGKGHETGQIVGDETLPFNDRESALLAMRHERALLMMRTLASLAQVTGGQLRWPGLCFHRRLHRHAARCLRARCSSRSVAPISMAMTLQPMRTKRGAAALLVDHQLPVDLPQVVVADVLAALTRFAGDWRRRFSLPLVGVTGSNGKTTTKEILGTILAREGSCLVTRGNLNNHIGVPLMLLELEPSHRSAVIEMGANHAGEIAHLAAVAQPTVGLVTNAGAAHLEGFGSLDGVARAKGEMFSALCRSRHGRHQCRRSLCTACGRVSQAHPGSSRSASRMPRMSSLATCVSKPVLPASVRVSIW